MLTMYESPIEFPDGPYNNISVNSYTHNPSSSVLTHRLVLYTRHHDYFQSRLGVASVTALCTFRIFFLQKSVLIPEYTKP